MRKTRRPRKAGPLKPQAPQPRVIPRRTRLAVGLLVFIALMLIYQATVLRTAVDQDSGELVAAVHVQGIPHPTGYPLWLLLGRLFDYLPLGGTTAYRVGMMCAVGVAAAGALTSLAALALTGEALPALFAGLAFGLWTPPWADLARAMVHAITGLFVAIAILGLRRWNAERSAKSLLWLSLAVGFAAMHHRTAFLVLAPAFLTAYALTPPRCRGRYWALAWLGVTGLVVSLASHFGMVVMAIAFIVMLSYALVRRTCFRTYLAGVCLFLAPFTCYLYLWIRALARPAVNWTDPTTLDRLIYHVFAKQYLHFAFANDSSQMLDYAAKLAPDLLAPSLGLGLLLGIAGLPLIIWGWVLWRRREPAVALSLLVGSALLAFWVLKWGEASDLKHFFSPLGPGLAIAGALALAQVGSLPRLGRLRLAAPAVLGVLVCGSLALANYPRCDFSDRWANRDRWAAVLLQMEPNAVFVSDFDQPSFVTLYLQNVEGLRPDVTLIRTVRLPAPSQPDQWYLNLIGDRGLREAVRVSWQEALRAAQEIHEQSALFAYLLAKRLPARPVYAVHGPMQVRPPGPPYFLGLSEDLVRLTALPSDMTRRQAPTPALASLPGGITLAAFKLDRGEAGAGETVGFAADWRLANPLSRLQFAVALLPEGMDFTRALTKTDTAERLVQAFPLCYGLWGTGPSPEGTAYEQRGQAIVPTNAAPGAYRLAVALAPLYSMDYQGWTEVGRIRVSARPRPRNGP